MEHSGLDKEVPYDDLLLRKAFGDSVQLYISIFIPCHRVIGSNHSLTGFAGGLATKRILLELEAEQKQHKLLIFK